MRKVGSFLMLNAEYGRLQVADSMVNLLMLIQDPDEPLA
jgi:hypothetical protein